RRLLVSEASLQRRRDVRAGSGRWGHHRGAGRQSDVPPARGQPRESGRGQGMGRGRDARHRRDVRGRVDGGRGTTAAPRWPLGAGTAQRRGSGSVPARRDRLLLSELLPPSRPHRRSRRTRQGVPSGARDAALPSAPVAVPRAPLGTKGRPEGPGIRVMSEPTNGPPTGRPPRIAFLTPEYPTEQTGRGGVGSYVDKMAHALVTRGHDCTVFVTSRQEGETDHGGVRVVCVGATRSPWWRALARLLRPLDPQA